MSSTTEQICTTLNVVEFPDVITCAKFRTEIVRGYAFTGGRIFDFPIASCMGVTTM